MESKTEAIKKEANIKEANIKEANIMKAIFDRWDEVKETIKKESQMTDISYQTWIAPLKIHNIENNVINIIIPVNLSPAFDYINLKYKSFFQGTLTEMFNHYYDVNFILEKDIKLSETSSDNIEKSSTYNVKYDNANLNPKYTFDTFIVGSNNRLAHQASLAVAESPGEVYNPLFIYGESGLGKTHLMQSIGHFILEKNPDKKVLYVISEDFTNEVIESIRSGKSGNAAAMMKLREKYRTVDVLMIDDVQFIIGKDATQEEFFHTFNALRENGKQVILTSDKPPKKMETLDDRFLSRFNQGLIADIQAPDYETRMAILLQNAERYNRHIDEEIIKYIASNVKSNIRELEGALNKVIAFGKLNNLDITIDSAKEALKDIISPNKVKDITPSLILDVVAEQFGVSKEGIASESRKRELVIPRHIVMYLSSKYTNYSQQEIAKVLNKKDHTTVINGVKNVKEEIGVNEELQNKVDIIMKKLNIPMDKL